MLVQMSAEFIGNFPDPQNVVGTVDIANMPAVQTVDGSVAVSNLPATQAVAIPDAIVSPLHRVRTRGQVGFGDVLHGLLLLAVTSLCR